MKNLTIQILLTSASPKIRKSLFSVDEHREITRIAKENEVSRLFIYKLLWQMAGLFESKEKEISRLSHKEEQRKIDQHILLLRLEGKSSLEAISEILRHLGFSAYSTGYISARISTFAQSLPSELVAEAKIVFYLSDEIFANGQPILVTVDAKSLAILRIELANSRNGEVWQAHWQELAKAGYLDSKVVGHLIWP